MYKYFKMNKMQTCFLPSIANLKCTPSDKQMYPSLGTPVQHIWLARIHKMLMPIYFSYDFIGAQAKV